MLRRLLHFLTALTPAAALLAPQLAWPESGAASVAVQSSRARPDICVTRPEDVADPGFLDRSFDRISAGICYPGRWVDQFFEDPDDLSADHAYTQLRIIQANRWQDNGERGDELRVRARVRLPNMQERWLLVFRNDEDINDDAQELDRDPASVGIEEDDESTARAALRWARSISRRFELDMDVGARSDLKGYWRARYRYQRPLGESLWWARFSQKGYWEDPDGWGLDTSLQFDRPLTSRLTLRFNHELEWTEERNELDIGLGWTQTASLYHALRKRSAVQYLVGWSGNTKPATSAQVYRTAVRFRRSVWKPWFYYEIEPYAFWPRADDFHGVTGIVGRLEIQLGQYD